MQYMSWAYKIGLLDVLKMVSGGNQQHDIYDNFSCN